MPWGSNFGPSSNLVSDFGTNLVSDFRSSVDIHVISFIHVGDGDLFQFGQSSEDRLAGVLEIVVFVQFLDMNVVAAPLFFSRNFSV